MAPAEHVMQERQLELRVGAQVDDVRISTEARILAILGEVPVAANAEVFALPAQLRLRDRTNAVRREERPVRRVAAGAKAEVEAERQPGRRDRRRDRHRVDAHHGVREAERVGAARQLRGRTQRVRPVHRHRVDANNFTGRGAFFRDLDAVL